MKEPVEIPLPEDTPLYSIRITLDGVEYLFKFDWSDREQRWYLSILTVAEEPLALGIKVVANWHLLRRFTDSRLPQGVLMATDLGATLGESPVFEDLGKRVRLMYLAPG